MSTILSVHELSKSYNNGSRSLKVLDNISFTLKAGESLSIVGPSGSGKTTLLGLAAGMDTADEGVVFVNDININQLNEDDRAQVRNEHIGFIFQNFQLISTLTALENVMVPLELRGDTNARKVAESLIEQVGLIDRQHHYPSQLSGGEQQRVAIARAFSNSPNLLFADEPTGNLDIETGQKIEELLFDLNREKGTALVLVTHDVELSKRTQQVIHLKGGKIDAPDLIQSKAS
jgi:putative ABC transport system ATP-binding protein